MTAALQNARPVPVTILSGFLGAGKTTLLNRLLKEAPERLAILVNDFAAINVDIELVEAADENRISLSNGCVCCTIRDDLVAAALTAAAATPPPDRLVIETSGVSNPVAVADAFLAPHVADRLIVETTLCVVDSETFPDLDYASTELAIDQAAVADLVLLNKCDLVRPADVDAVEETLRGALPVMRIIRTVGAAVPWAVIGTLPDRPEAMPVRRDHGDHDHGEHAHDHSHTYASWSWSGGILDLDAFRTFVRTLPTGILRAKGVVRFRSEPGQRGVFQLVGKRSKLELQPDPEGAATSTFVLIGLAGSFSPAELDQRAANLPGMAKVAA